MRAADVARELKSRGTPERARASAWFFKTGKGEYGYGDVFYGVSVPEQRIVAKQFRDLPLSEIDALLKHKAHECRLTALIILVAQYRRANEKEKQRIAKFYLAHTQRINNWDLVDSSAPQILGDYLLTRNRTILYSLARSKNLWQRRISVLATFAFIAKNDFKDALAIAEMHLADTHDLIHKAVGWMLREIGKRSKETEVAFLQKHAATMPRTMLRYAIERFPEEERRGFLKKKIV